MALNVKLATVYFKTTVEIVLGLNKNTKRMSKNILEYPAFKILIYSFIDVNVI